MGSFCQGLVERFDNPCFEALVLVRRLAAEGHAAKTHSISREQCHLHNVVSVEHEAVESIQPEHSLHVSYCHILLNSHFRSALRHIPVPHR